jgi:hypothetical protein
VAEVEVLYWDGVLDDLRVYSRVLPAGEIAAVAPAMPMDAA